MPTYAYHCNHCHADLDIFHSMSEPARTECPQCHEQSLSKMITAGAGIVFKGSGFYETDYKKTSSDETQHKPAKETCGDKKACACAASSIS